MRQISLYSIHELETACHDCQFVCFVCLFVWDFTSHLRIFHSYGDVTITGEGLQILTLFWILWSLSSEGSLACHGASVYNGHLRGPVTLTPVREHLAVELSLPVFTT